MVSTLSLMGALAAVMAIAVPTTGFLVTAAFHLMGG